MNRRVQIFLRLKRDEIWEELKITVMSVVAAVAIVFAAMVVLWLVGYCVTLVGGYPSDGIDKLAHGLCVAFISVFAAVCIVLKRWLEINWKIAGHLEREENG